MGMGMDGVLVPSTWRAPPRVSLYCSCLFGLVRHAGTATIVAEARVKRLCGAVCCVLSGRYWGWGGCTGNRWGGCLARMVLTGRPVYRAGHTVDPHVLRHGRTGGATPRFWTPTTPPTNRWPEAPWGGGGGGGGGGGASEGGVQGGRRGGGIGGAGGGAPGGSVGMGGVQVGQFGVVGGGVQVGRFGVLGGGGRGSWRPRTRGVAPPVHGRCLVRASPSQWLESPASSDKGPLPSWRTDLSGRAIHTSRATHC